MDIFEAIETGNNAELKTLISDGEDVNARNEYDYTPLMLAVVSENLDTLRILIKNHANVNAAEKVGGITALMAACVGDSEKDIEIVDIEIVNLLIASGADENATDYTGKTPIVAARENGNEHIVRALQQAVARRDALQAKAQSGGKPPQYGIAKESAGSLSQVPPKQGDKADKATGRYDPSKGP